MDPYVTLHVEYTVNCTVLLYMLDATAIAHIHSTLDLTDKMVQNHLYLQSWLPHMARLGCGSRHSKSCLAKLFPNY